MTAPKLSFEPMQRVHHRTEPWQEPNRFVCNDRMKEQTRIIAEGGSVVSFDPKSLIDPAVMTKLLGMNSLKKKWVTFEQEPLMTASDEASLSASMQAAAVPLNSNFWKEVDLTSVLESKVMAGEFIYVSGELDEVKAKVHIAQVNALMKKTGKQVVIVHTPN